jgi:hypothetical protein
VGAAGATSQIRKLFRDILLSSVTNELSEKVVMAAVNDRNKSERGDGYPGVRNIMGCIEVWYESPPIGGRRHFVNSKKFTACGKLHDSTRKFCTVQPCVNISNLHRYYDVKFSGKVKRNFTLQTYVHVIPLL